MSTAVRTALLMLAILFAFAAATRAADAPAKAAAKPKRTDQPVTEDQIKQVQAALPAQATVKPAQPRKMLILTATKSARHGTIPLAAKTLELMGAKTGAWETTITNEIADCTAANLAKFDALCSDQCTGALTDDEGIKKAILDYVKGGKGWVGIHAATDVGAWKFTEYNEMTGGVFAGHPFKHISVKVDDPTHPLCAVFGGKGFDITDEIYTFRDPYSRDKLRVLLSMDWENCGNPKGANRADNDYALAWVRSYGQGRVFYCAFGHQEPIWYNPVILRFYLDGIQFALGDLKADTTPIAKMTPAPTPARGPVLPPAPEPPAKAAPKAAAKK
jgi:type 1 glutamine amidotransferase